MTIQERIAAELEKHTPIDSEVDGVPEDEIWCDNIECGFKMKGSIEYEEARDFAEHQAEVLAAIVREAQAEALREAAEEWEGMVIREKPPIRGYTFLRARADRIEAGE